MDKILLSNQFPSGQTIELVQGDITEMKVDAIVNAANAFLQHGGGVAAAITRKGGPSIQQESNQWVREHGPVSHENPAFTTGGNLPARYVIHAVGPVGGEIHADEKLSAAICGSLTLAENLKVASLAFPAISTGIFGFPKDRAAQIFYQTISQFCSDTQQSRNVRTIKIVLFDSPTITIFVRHFHDYFPQKS